jgi:hypothetical protein
MITDVSFHDLVKGGFFEIIPELDDSLYRDPVWLRLQQFREEENNAPGRW